MINNKNNNNSFLSKDGEQSNVRVVENFKEMSRQMMKATSGMRRIRSF